MYDVEIKYIKLLYLLLVYLIMVGGMYNIYKIETPSFPKYWKMFIGSIGLIFATFLIIGHFYLKFQ